MTKRQQINSKIRCNEIKIEALEKINIQLRKQSLLLCDKEQWFKEETRTVGRGKKKRDERIGYISWNEDFKDESTGDVVTIERSEIVMIDGIWQ